MESGKLTLEQGIGDDEVLGRVLEGDKNSYELIMRKYNQRLYRIVRTYIKDEDEIEDVMQEAYIKAYVNLPRFERRSNFSTWLIRIAINEALARVKHRKRFSPTTDDEWDEPGLPREELTQMSNTLNPAGVLMNAELKEILEKAVDLLPEKYRSVFLLREIEDMSIAETSASLEISETNVKARLSRAKEMLRETITESYRGAELFHFDLVRCDRIVHNVLQRIEAV